MKVSYKKHIIDEINETIRTAQSKDKRIDVILLDQYEWKSFKDYMTSNGDDALADTYNYSGAIVKFDGVQGHEDTGD